MFGTVFTPEPATCTSRSGARYRHLAQGPSSLTEGSAGSSAGSMLNRQGDVMIVVLLELIGIWHIVAKLTESILQR